MLSARWTADGIELADVEPPPLPDGWVRLAVTGCGICGSDLHILRGMRAGTSDPAEFGAPGHEIAGTLIEAQPGMADTVYAVEPWINCRVCPHCLRGDTVLCQDGDLLGIRRSGGLATHVDVPPRLLHPVDESVDPVLASLAEPWAVSVRAVHRARLTELDERVLILGGGNIGLLAGLAARDRAARVGITCRYPHQAALARQFGLEPIGEAELDDWAHAHGPGVVIETVGGEADTMADAIRTIRPGGRVVVVGVFHQPRPTSYREVVIKELELIGSFIYGTVESGSEFGAAVGRMGTISNELAALQTHHFPLTEVEAAFAAADDKASRAVKVTIGGDPGASG